jgi:vancomycin resistance protein YoaR
VARSIMLDDRPPTITRPEGEGGRVVVLLVLGLALLAGGCYLAAFLAASNKVPVGTRVGGVDIGGHDPTTAATLLREGLADRAEAPFTVVVNGRTLQVPPQQVGLGVDYAASVHAAGAQRSWSLSRLWDYYTGGDRLDPVKVLDQTRLATLVQRLDRSDGSGPTDGSVVFHRNDFVVVPPRDGLQVDAQGAGTELWNAYLSDDPRVQLPLVATAPVIDGRTVHRFVADFANPAMASAVTLRLGQQTVRLQPSSYAGLLGSERAGDRLRPTVRAPGLARVVAERVTGRPADAPRDATVALVDGRPQVVPSRPGTVYAPADLATALVAAIRAPDRTADVRASRAPASFTSDDARGLGIRRQISSATLSLPVGSHVAALTSAVARLDGTVLKPGEGLSLRDVLGDDVPGDEASSTQLATATFNAAWLGGFPVSSHATLPSYTGDYPVGRDATLRNGQDLAFTDATTYGVLVSVTTVRPTAGHDGSLSVSLWSTPRWSVTSHHSTPANVVPAGRVVESGQGCQAQAGLKGFDVTVTRTFSDLGSGTADHSASYDVHYAPVPAVVCKPHAH